MLAGSAPNLILEIIQQGGYSMKKILLLTVGVVFAAGYAMQAAAETTLRMNLWLPPFCGDKRLCALDRKN